MNPNPDIWGAPETWLNAKGYWQGGENNGNPTIKAERAKISNFGGSNDEYVGSLGRAYDNNIITLDPIDNSIVPCGQNPAASAYGTIKLFKNKQSVEQNIIPDKVITQNQPINWFFYYMTGYNYYSTNTMTRYGRVDFNNAKMRMYPNAEAGTIPLNYNPNLLITPIVHYQIRSIWSVIWVQLDNNTYGGGNWCTLEDWKNNYSSQPIRNINMDIFGYSSDNGSTVTYSRGANLNDGEANNVAFMGDIDGINCYTAFTFERAPVITIANSIDYNYYNSDFTFCAVGWRDDWENSTIKSYVRESTEHGWCVWQSVPYTVANYEKIMQMAACFGVPFSDSNHSSIPIDFNAAYVCLPVINEDGVATGEYTRGSDNLTNPYAQLDSVRDTNYDPNKDIDPNTYSNQTYFNPVLNLSSMCKRYVLNDAAVEQLCRDLWKISDDLIHTDPDEDFKDYDQLMLDNFLVNSPIDVIVSLDKYPISDIPTGTTAEAIKYGKATGAALGKPLTTNTIFFNFEGVRIYPKFERSFLDYSPYTCYELYIPFCGIVSIDAGDIMDHILSVQMVMDLSTGAVTAYIMADNLCIETANGMAALNIPVSGIDSVTLNSQINNALINAKSAQMQARSSGTLTGRIAGGLKSIKDSLNARTATMQRASDTWTANLADYDLTHMPISPHKIGSASAACSWSLELTCRLMIYYPEGDAIDSSGGVSPNSPKLADLTMYGHTTGFATISSGSVSEYHGFTVGNIDTSSIQGATEAEREMIKALFSQGVYLP